MKTFDPKKIKIDQNSCKNILMYYIAHVTIKDSKYVKLNSVNPLLVIIRKVKGYFGKINGNKYLTLIPANESKKIKRYEKVWNKIRDLIRSITKNSDDYDVKYI